MTVDICRVFWHDNGSGRYNDYYEVRWKGAKGTCTSFGQFSVGIRTPTSQIDYPVKIGSVVKTDFNYNGKHYNKDGSILIKVTPIPVVISIPLPLTIKPVISVPEINKDILKEIKDETEIKSKSNTILIVGAIVVGIGIIWKLTKS